MSSGSPEPHKRFASNHRLPFILLSDVDNKARKLYRAYGASGILGLPGRATYVIDTQRIICYVSYSQIDPEIDPASEKPKKYYGQLNP